VGKREERFLLNSIHEKRKRKFGCNRFCFERKPAIRKRGRGNILFRRGGDLLDA